jgi:hypothetical protein
MPSLDTAEAVEWQCRSTRVVDGEFVLSFVPVIAAKFDLQIAVFCIPDGKMV